MPISTTHETLLDLLEQKRSSNHHKVALRYFFMLEALGHPIPAAQRRYCGAAMHRCTPRDLERIQSAARDWATFVNGAMPRITPSIALDELVEHVLKILGSHSAECRRHRYPVCTESRGRAPSAPTKL
ncbi:hypothetical protein [Hydrogenophaga sp.]|uniref:hypothetical protein n=1 Tax=Hydrogenophaga sp. TaxID=1904254 RepID=UPI002715E4C8|nr:hypothetical protein [Hydrogenophaga sp.]MDO8906552.1 hypothetical protein [Hydrogenophaga sp.]